MFLINSVNPMGSGCYSRGWIWNLGKRFCCIAFQKKNISMLSLQKLGVSYLIFWVLPWSTHCCSGVVGKIKYQCRSWRSFPGGGRAPISFWILLLWTFCWNQWGWGGEAERLILQEEKEETKSLILKLVVLQLLAGRWWWCNAQSLF